MEENEEKVVRYYKFDTKDEAVCDEYGASKSAVFNDIKDCFVDCHFIQESGIVSDEPISVSESNAILRKGFNQKPWLAKCISKMQMTDLIEHHDIFKLAVDFCNGVEPTPTNDKEKRNFYVTYDLSLKKLEKHFSNSSKGYELLSKELENEGFHWEQRSAVLSNEKMTYDEAMLKISNVCKKLTWLSDCLTHFDVSVQGKLYDLSDDINRYANESTLSPEIMKARDELVLGLHSDGINNSLYVKDKELGICYKYEFNDKEGAFFDRIYTKFNKLANEVAMGDFSSFKEVKNKEYNKAISESNIVFDKLIERDKNFNFAQTRKDFNVILYALQNERFNKHEDLDVAIDFSNLEYSLVNKDESIFSSLSYYSNEKIHNLIDDKVVRIENPLYKTLDNQLFLPEGCTMKDSSEVWFSLYKNETAKNAVMFRKIGKMYLSAEMGLDNMKEAVSKFVKENFTDLGYPAQAVICQSKFNEDKYVATVFSSDRKLINNEWAKEKKETFFIDNDGNKINPVPSPVIKANGKVFREEDGSIRMQMGYLPFKLDENGNPKFLDKEKTIPDRIELRVPVLDKDGKPKMKIKGKNKVGKRGKELKPKISPVFKIASYIDGHKWNEYIYDLKDSWFTIVNDVCEKNHVVGKDGKPLKIIAKNGYQNFLDYVEENPKSLNMSFFFEKQRNVLREIKVNWKKKFVNENNNEKSIS